MDPQSAQQIGDYLNLMYGYINSNFDISSDEIVTGELDYVISSIDVSKWSCVQGISSSICRDNFYRLR